MFKEVIYKAGKTDNSKLHTFLNEVRRQMGTIISLDNDGQVGSVISFSFHSSEQNATGQSMIVDQSKK